VQIRRLPKPVVAMVAGYAVGGGHILHLVCDLTIAADNAVSGRRVRAWAASTAASAPRSSLATSASRRPRDLVLSRLYDADEALEMGLVNTVVPLGDLERETVAWCREMAPSPPLAEASEVELMPPRTASPGSSSSPTTPRCSST